MDVTESFGWLFVVCLLPGAFAAGSYCLNSAVYCPLGCCYDYSQFEVCCIEVIYSPSYVVESTLNLPVILGASVGGFLLLVVIVSVVVSIICCTKTNRRQVGQVVEGQTMVVAGSYMMQTTNMQPGINTLQQQQQPYNENQTTHL